LFLGSQAILWIQTYPQYAYPIIAALCILLLSILFGIFRRFCCTPKRNNRSNRISKLPARVVSGGVNERALTNSNQALVAQPYFAPVSYHPSPQELPQPSLIQSQNYRPPSTLNPQTTFIPSLNAPVPGARHSMNAWASEDYRRKSQSTENTRNSYRL
jgi:hypothetical protein